MQEMYPPDFQTTEPCLVKSTSIITKSTLLWQSVNKVLIQVQQKLYVQWLVISEYLIRLVYVMYT